MIRKQLLVAAMVVATGYSYGQLVSDTFPWDGVGGSVTRKAIHLVMLPNGSLIITAEGNFRSVSSHAEPRYGFSGTQSWQDYSGDALLITPKTNGWSAFPISNSSLTVSSAALAWGSGGNSTGTSMALSGAAFDSNLFCSSHVLLPDRSGSAVFFGGNEFSETVAGAQTLNHQGSKHIYKFTPGTQTAMQSWSRLTNSMTRGRWYPTSQMLPSGQILTLAGSGSWMNAANSPWAEGTTYNPVTGYEITSIWPGGDYTSYVPTIMDNSGTMSINPAPNSFDYSGNAFFMYYPFPIIVPTTGAMSTTGRVLLAGPQRDSHWMNPVNHSIAYGRPDNNDLSRVGYEYPSVATLHDDNENWTQVIIAGGGNFVNSSTNVSTTSARRMFFGTPPTDYLTASNTQFSITAEKWYTNTEVGQTVPYWLTSTASSNFMAPMHVTRKNFQLVPLPNMTVMALNGNERNLTDYDSFSSSTNAASRPQRCPEIFNPKTNIWTIYGDTITDNKLAADPNSNASFKVDRGYHSTAALLPDGRVMSAGGDAIEGSDQTKFELFKPPYMDVLNPPLWVTDTLAGGTKFYNDTFNLSQTSTVMTLSGTKTFESAVLVTLPSTTHSYNFGQRMIKLRPVKNGSNVTTGFQMPRSPVVAPPGWYMFFVVDSAGAVSKAKIIRLTEPYSRRPMEIFSVATGEVDTTNDVTEPFENDYAAQLNSLVHGDGWERTTGTAARAGRLRLTPTNGVIEVEFLTVLPATVSGEMIRFRLESRASRTGINGAQVGFYELFVINQQDVVAFTKPNAVIFPSPGTSDRIDVAEENWFGLTPTYPENFPYEPSSILPGEWMVKVKWTGLTTGDWIEIDQAQFGGYQADPE